MPGSSNSRSSTLNNWRASRQTILLLTILSLRFESRSRNRRCGKRWIGLIGVPDLAYAKFIVPLILTGVGASIAMPAAQNAVVSRVDVIITTGRKDGSPRKKRLLSDGCQGVGGNGWVFSHSARALTVGSIPTFSHQAASFPQRCTSRWCPRQSGTVNSSLTLRPSALDCAKRR
jgi:hypothetical protein